MNKTGAKVLRIAAIIFMGLTAAMNLLGGAGTVCAAFLTKKFPPMWALMDYQLLYQALMITTIIIGLVGIWAMVGLIKGGEKVYRNVLIVLIIGTLLGGTQFFASLAIRGKAVPANMKFYANLITLIIFLVLGLPGIRKVINFSKNSTKDEKIAAAGITAFLMGATFLSTFLWVTPSHTYLGNNWVEVLETPLLVVGSILILGGVLSTGWAFFNIQSQEKTEASYKPA